jgi:hypothetical protein
MHCACTYLPTYCVPRIMAGIMGCYLAAPHATIAKCAREERGCTSEAQGPASMLSNYALQGVIDSSKPRFVLEDERFARIAARRLGRQRGSPGFGNARAVGVQV